MCSPLKSLQHFFFTIIKNDHLENTERTVWLSSIRQYKMLKTIDYIHGFSDNEFHKVKRKKQVRKGREEKRNEEKEKRNDERNKVRKKNQKREKDTRREKKGTTAKRDHNSN